MPQPFDVVAKFVVDDFVKFHPALGAEAVRADLALRIETALRAAVREERDACASLCDGRQALWLDTEVKPKLTDLVRAEARARSKEAAYIADAIRAR